MQIGGFVKSSLIDYPGKVAAVIFTQGCNFRCPFCHNTELVIPSAFQTPVSEEEVTGFLVKRRDVLQGVVVSGGEPTLQPDLPEFLLKIKALDFPVKLDTNGSQPKVLKELIARRLVDYVAMDVKTSLERYPEACGVEVGREDILKSIDILDRSTVEHEFRTTAVRSLAGPEDFSAMKGLIPAARHYHIQPFVPQANIIDHSLLDERQYTEEELLELKDRFEKRRVPVSSS